MSCPGYGDINDRSKFEPSQDGDTPPSGSHFGYITECMDNPECHSGFREIDEIHYSNTYGDTTYPTCGWAWQDRKVCQRDWNKLMTSQRKLDCCLGHISGPAYCHPDYCRNSDGCRSTMKQYCEQPSNFFKPECKTWLKNLKNDALKDQIANKICPTVKEVGTPDQKAFCACYNVEIPKGLEDQPALHGQLLCLSQACGEKDKALQPAQHYGTSCPINNVVCTMTDVLQQAHDSGTIGTSEIEQKCGVTFTADGRIVKKVTPDTAPDDDDQDDTDDDQATTDDDNGEIMGLSRTTVIGIVAAVVVFSLLIMIAFMVM